MKNLPLKYILLTLFLLVNYGALHAITVFVSSSSDFRSAMITAGVDKIIITTNNIIVDGSSTIFVNEDKLIKKIGGLTDVSISGFNSSDFKIVSLGFNLQFEELNLIDVGVYVSNGNLSFVNCVLRDTEINSAIPGSAFRLLKGNLYMNECEVIDNSSVGSNGGAGGVYGAGKVEIIDTKFTSNNVKRAGKNGGALYLQSCQLVLFSEVDFDRNNAQGDGGAVYMRRCAAINIDKTSFFANYAVGKGGAMAQEDCLGLSVLTTNTSFFANQSDEASALYSDAGHLTFRDCSFTYNWHDTDGGVVKFDRSGNINPGILRVDRTTFAYNFSLSTTAIEGLLNMYNYESDFINSTISNNQGYSFSGINASVGSVDLSFTTITENNAENPPGVALHLWPGTQLQTQASIIANNQLWIGGSLIGEGNLIVSDPFLFASTGFNLIGDDVGYPLSSLLPNDLHGTAASPLNPALNPLAKNGGFGENHMPELTSICIDRGPAFMIGMPAFDQNSLGRFVKLITTLPAAHADIGAVERQTWTLAPRLAVDDNQQLIEPSNHDIAIFPTIFNDQLTIKSSARETETFAFYLLDLEGRIIHAQKLNAGTHMIDHLNDLRSGQYFAVIQSNTSRQVFKLLKI